MLRLTRMLATVLLYATVTFVARSAQLPAEVRSQLDEFHAALGTMFLEVKHTRIRNSATNEYIFTAYFQEDQMRVSAPGDTAFDREMLWRANTHPGSSPESPTLSIVKKTQVRNTTKTSLSFTSHFMRFPYFDSAGIYAPLYPLELRSFESLQPAVLHFQSNHDTMDISMEGKNIRVNFHVNDRVFLNLRSIDPEEYRHQIKGNISLNAEEKEAEIRNLIKTQSMTPMRRVSMLLDAEHGYLPKEREDRSSEGKLISRHKVTQWKHVKEKNIWLPLKCNVSYYVLRFSMQRFSENPIEEIAMELTHVDFSPRDIIFSLLDDPKYRVAGTRVFDETLATMTDGARRPVSLTIATDGKALRDKVSTITAANEMTPSKRRSVILLLLLAFSALPLFLLFRRFRPTKQR